MSNADNLWPLRCVTRKDLSTAQRESEEVKGRLRHREAMAAASAGQPQVGGLCLRCAQHEAVLAETHTNVHTQAIERITKWACSDGREYSVLLLMTNADNWNFYMQSVFLPFYHKFIINIEQSVCMLIMVYYLFMWYYNCGKERRCAGVLWWCNAFKSVIYGR